MSSGYTEIVLFGQRHGAVIEAALRAYAEDMAKTAAGFQAQYDAIKDRPPARAVQDQSLVTTSGLGHAAQSMREAAQRAELALAAFGSLVEDAEDKED